MRNAMILTMFLTLSMTASAETKFFTNTGNWLSNGPNPFAPAAQTPDQMVETYNREFQAQVAPLIQQQPKAQTHCRTQYWNNLNMSNTTCD